MRCIGLVGGLAVGSACHCYKALAQQWPRDRGPMEFCMVHADLPTVLECLSANDSDKLANYLLGLIERVKRAGATVAAIPAVAPHFSIKRLKEFSPLPIIDLLEVIVDEVRSRKLRRVTIFGTRYVIKSNLFEALDGVVEIASPSTEETDRIHELYLKLAQQAYGEPSDIAELNALAAAVLERERADAVLLAGTDFSVVPAGLFEFPHVDCTEAHLRAILRELCS